MNSLCSQLRQFTALLLAVFMLCIQAPSAHGKAEPGSAALLSVVPGLGQVVNGEALEGAGWFVTSLGLFFSGNGYARLVGFDIWMYQMYDAYRDAGAPNTTKYGIFANWPGAVFNPLNVIDPIGAPMIGLVALANKPRNSIKGPENVFSPLIFTAVAGGEEAMFRGFLFPAFSGLFHSKIAGAATSSVAFSLFHLGNGIGYDAQPFVLISRFVMGMLFCWQTDRNKYDLRKSVFAHAWIDTIVDWKHGGIKPIADLNGSSGFAKYFPDGLALGTKIHF